MTEEAIFQLVQGIASGLPRLVAAVKAGKNLDEIRIDEFISADALEVIRVANEKADDFIKNG